MTEDPEGTNAQLLANALSRAETLMDIAATSQHNSEARQMADFIQYRRTQIAEMRPWRFGDDMEGISVSEPDRENGSPREGDMIARNPKNYADQWLVAMQYFADNFEPFASKSLATPSMAGEDTTGAIRHAFDLLSSAVRCGEDWRPELDGALVKAREAVRSLSSRVEEAERARREEELREDARLGAALARVESSEALVAELREKVERLRKALEPFAKAASDYERQGEFFSDSVELVLRVSVFAAPEYHNSTAVQVGDLRRARSELEGRDNG